MNNELRHPLTDLTAGSILRLRDGQGMAVVVFEGLVWITQRRRPARHRTGRRRSFSVDRPGLTLVQAFRDSKLMVVEGGPQAAPWPAAELRRAASVGARAAQRGDRRLTGQGCGGIARRRGTRIRACTQDPGATTDDAVLGGPLNAPHATWTSSHLGPRRSCSRSR